MSRPLRIFLSCQQSVIRHPVPAYGFWAGYFRAAFAEAGHTCLEAPDCDWAEGLLPLGREARAAWQQRTWETAVAWLRREHARAPVDFFLGYLFPDQVLPAAVVEIRALGIPCVNFFCDNVRELRSIPHSFRAFDLHWVPEYRAVAMYQDAGLAWLNAPMACWVPPAERTPPDTENTDVAFIGTRDEQRAALFAAVLTRGLPVNLHGTGWNPAGVAPAPVPPPARNPFELARRQLNFAGRHGWNAWARKTWQTARPRPALPFDFLPHVRPAPAGAAYWHVLRECRVCLGVNRYPSWRFPFDRPDTYSRLRDLEAPMAGACYLTEWTEGLDRLYEPGVEVETYRDAAELVAKARELLADPARRHRLRAAGQQRALRDHSIVRTLARIAERLGICPPAA